eukprot:498353_1
MSHSDIYRITGIVTFIISLFSIVGATYLIRAISKNKRLDTANRDFLLNDYVLYLSMWDVVFHTLLGSYWFSVGFNIDYHWDDDNSHFCKFFGFLTQISIISSATWSFFIVINLFRLMNGSHDQDLKAKTLCVIRTCNVKHNHVIVWIVALTCSFIPIQHYGPTENPEKKEGIHSYECWIVDQWHQLTLYAPLALYIACSAFVFLWIGCRRCGIVSQGDVRAYIHLENQLLSFSVLFFVVYLFPTIERIWALVAGHPQIVFVVLHHVLLSMIGFGNFLIWKYVFPLKRTDREQSLLVGNNPNDVAITDTFEELVNGAGDAGDVPLQP